MNRKSSSRGIKWIFFLIIAVTVIFSFRNMNYLFNADPNSVQSLPFPQKDPTWLRWSASWGGSNPDFAEDVWADQYYIYVCGTLDIGSGNDKLILARYSEWEWGLQQWNVTWSSGVATSGKAIWGYGNYIYTAGVYSDNLVLIKWYNNGTQIWISYWNLNGNSGNVEAVWGTEDSIYTCGTYIDDLLLIKWDNDGNQQWNRTWGGMSSEQGLDIWVYESEIYTCGSTSSYGAGLNDSLIIKWDSEGNQVWNRTSGTPYEDKYTSISGFITEIYVCGNIWNSSYSTTDILIMKWDSDGNNVWNRTYTSPETDKAYCIWANEYYLEVAGTTLRWNAEYEKIILLKYTFGGLLVDESYPTWDYEYEYIPKAIFGTDSRFYVCGWYNGSSEIPGDYDQYLFQFVAYHLVPIPFFFVTEPQPSVNGSFTLIWEEFDECEFYHLYKDNHPILNFTDRIPYQILTNTSFIETGQKEDTYFYYVTSFLKGIESEVSNPCIVQVDLPDSPKRKIPGYNMPIFLGILGFTIFFTYKKMFTKR
jgi:hypothetical protein